MKLRDWPEFDLIHPAGAGRLIAGSKTVRTIEIIHSVVKCCFSKKHSTATEDSHIHSQCCFAKNVWC